MQTPHADWWELPPRPALLLAIGVCLGPQVLDVIKADTLDLLAPIVPLGLCAFAVSTILHRKSVAVNHLVILSGAVSIVLLASDPVDLSTVLVRLWRTIAACGGAALIGLAGLMLLRSHDSPTARRVFMLALVLLLGGVADFSATPALVAGIVAAMMWRGMSRRSVVWLGRDVEYVARPLVTGLLLITGARLSLSETTLIVSVAGAVAVLLVNRGASMPGLFALAVAIDLARGVDAGLAPVAHGAVVALMLVQAVEFIWGGNRTAAPVLQEATE